MKAPLRVVFPAAALAVAVAASATSPALLAVAVLTAQALLGAGWYAARLLPAAGVVVAVAAGASADLLVLRQVGTSVAPFAAVLAATVAAALAVHLVVQQRQASVVRIGRQGPVFAATGTLASIITVSVLAVLMSALVATREITHGREITVAVLVTAGLVTAGLTVSARQRPARLLVAGGPGQATSLIILATLVAAGALGIVAGIRRSEVGMHALLPICLATGLLTLVACLVVSFLDQSDLAELPESAERTGPVALGRRGARSARRAAAKATRRQEEATLLLSCTLPLSLAAPAAYLLARLLVE